MHAQNSPREAARRLAGSKFVYIKNVARDPSVRHLSCRIAVLLLEYVDAKSRLAWPSQVTLAVHAGVTPRAIREGLKNLAACGYIEIIRNSHRRSNLYRPLLPIWSPERGTYLPTERKVGSLDQEAPFPRLLDQNPNKSTAPSRPSGTAPEGRAAIGREMQLLATRLGSRMTIGHAGRLAGARKWSGPPD